MAVPVAAVVGSCLEEPFVPVSEPVEMGPWGYSFFYGTEHFDPGKEMILKARKIQMADLERSDNARGGRRTALNVMTVEDLNKLMSQVTRKA